MVRSFIIVITLQSWLGDGFYSFSTVFLKKQKIHASRTPSYFSNYKDLFDLQILLVFFTSFYPKVDLNSFVDSRCCLLLTSVCIFYNVIINNILPFSGIRSILCHFLFDDCWYWLNLSKLYDISKWKQYLRSRPFQPSCVKPLTMPVTTGLRLHLGVGKWILYNVEKNVFSYDFKGFMGKGQNELPLLEAGSCIFFPCIFRWKSRKWDFPSVLPRGRIFKILYHTFAHYLRFKILRAVYVHTRAHTPHYFYL